MTNSKGLRSAVCIAAIFAGGAAHADVTAAQVWEDWKSQIALYGEDSLTIGSEDASGDTLTVRDLAINMSDDDVTVNAALGDITFEEQGDGSVKVTMSESYPILITPVTGAVVTIDVSQSGLEMIVSGDPDAMRYDVSADSYKVALRDVVDGDITFTGDAQLTANDLDATYTSATGDLREITYDATLASVDFLVDIQVPGAEGEYVVASGKIAGMAMEGDMALPLDADFDNPDDLFTNGFAFSGGYTVDRADYVFDINADGDQLAGSVSTGNTNLNAQMSAEIIGYDATTTDVAVNIASGDLPFPVEVSMAEYGFGLEMPVAKADAPSDFRFSFDFIDIVLNDMVWDMFDPGTVLPRDPSTLQFALSGQARPLFDVMDPAQADAMNDADMPFELNAVNLDALKIALAGALITGEGAFTFDNSDLTTFDGFPRPEGDVVIQGSGINGLIDNLVAMGLLPEDQVMGGRMMLGMFTQVTGDDQLETKLEVNADGQVLANGQRIR
ncbi:DUF2125 domain-containing protein [Yoonia sp. SS1-5]|uniref:DUF2125 domain-containing protein n=1 Tax=Yoonia rhodophyticola TaxID=3137370 RepID=A0AAN0MAJ5_9RHOB